MRHWLTLVTLGLSTVVALPARAEPDEGAKLVARELMAKGRAQRDTKDFQGALASFSKAHAIMHVPTTLVEAARARADAGLLLEALELLHQLQDMAAKPGEPAPFAKARADAQQLGSELEGRVPSLSIDLGGSPRAAATKLWIDGISRPDCVSTCRVNPGRHLVLARAPAAQAEEQIEINEREAQQLELVFSPDPPSIAATGVARSPAASPPGDVGAPRPRVSTLTWTLGGVALAGLAAGTVLGLSTVSRRNELRQQCAPSCDPRDVEDVRRRAIFTNVSLGVGVAAAALAVTSYVLGRPQAQASDTARKPTRFSVAAAPDPQARGGYVALGGSF